jgi:hypothetical protein
VLAHAGGIDEIIVVVGLILLLLVFRSTRAERGKDGPQEGPCLYCGAFLRAGEERCASCGFRARPGTREQAPAVRET